MKQTEIVGIIGILLFFVKVAMHIILKSISDKQYASKSLSRYNPIGFELLIHYYDDVPNRYRWLKNITNLIWAFFVLLIIIFLIGENV